MTMAWNPKDAAVSADSLIVGDSAAMVELRHLVRQVARSSASIIVTGPSGSGKEMVARAIHAESNRAAKSYVAVNCGAIPRDLLESELFGHEKGSFTGAFAQRRGRFEDAHGGTLFLDEIGDMPAEMQVKLLRVLEERAITRVGASQAVAVDTRIVSATHRNLEAAISNQSFREDLFYRLAVFPIAIPSLKERAEDVPLLVRHLLRQGGEKRSVRFNQTAMDRLIRHPWPGNVRELRNVVERAAILFPGETIGAEQVAMLLQRTNPEQIVERAALWEASSKAASPVRAMSEEPAAMPQLKIEDAAIALAGGAVDLRTLVADYEQRYISEALRLSEGVVAEAARMLGLQRTTLIEKMRKYELGKAA